MRLWLVTLFPALLFGCGQSSDDDDNGAAGGGQGGSAQAGASSGGTGGSSGKGGSAGASAGASGSTSSGGSSSGGSSPGDVCDGFPPSCIPLCEGGNCSCYCEPGSGGSGGNDCSDKPADVGSCTNCYTDEQCSGSAVCYGGDCTTSSVGVCRTPPGGGQCWGDRDCMDGETCSGAKICGCDMACLVPDEPGSCG